MTVSAPSAKQGSPPARAEPEPKPARAGEFHYRWVWHVAVTPADLWPLIADTDRFNRDSGLPVVSERAGPAPANAGGSALVRRLRARIFGVRIEWEEEPFEWIEPERFGVVRRYRAGPLAELRVLVVLNALDGGGTEVVYEVWALARGLLGRLLIPLQIGLISRRRFEATIRRYELAASTAPGSSALPSPGSPQPPPAPPLEFGHAAGWMERIRGARLGSLESGADAGATDRLIATIINGSQPDLARMRAYQLADDWGLPRKTVLEACLLGTRAGLLELQWDVVCPLCRGSKEGHESLGDLQATTHCDSCNIDFAVNLERFVEATFRPSPSIREVTAQTYCVGGPRITPHIIAQVKVAPGQAREISTRLEPGRYRARAPGVPGGQAFTVREDGAWEAELGARDSGWFDDEPCVRPQASLRLENRTTSERWMLVERMAWTDKSTTAADVLTLQLFRDLYASEALRPGEKLSVGTVTILFTDLKDSTRLYRRIGDGPAFGRVADHFDVLRDAVDSNRGAIVKTIGDSVMAVFQRPAGAVRAAMEAQRSLAGGELSLKAGVHAGPCLAVTLNGRLDYFGAVVNIAARLPQFATDARIVASAAVARDPEVAAMIADGTAGAERFSASVKGYEEAERELWRIGFR